LSWAKASAAMLASTRSLATFSNRVSRHTGKRSLCGACSGRDANTSHGSQSSVTTPLTMSSKRRRFPLLQRQSGTLSFFDLEGAMVSCWSNDVDRINPREGIQRSWQSKQRCPTQQFKQFGSDSNQKFRVNELSWECLVALIQIFCQSTSPSMKTAQTFQPSVGACSQQNVPELQSIDLHNL